MSLLGQELTFPSSLVVNTDGACRGNPGPSAAGWVFFDAAQNILARGHLFLGHRTNNEAEYLAAALGLKAALELKVRQVCLRADSQLMVRQLNGVYQVRNPRIQTLHTATLSLARQFPEGCRFEHVRREFNTAADGEANLALDEERSRARP